MNDEKCAQDSRKQNHQTNQNHRVCRPHVRACRVRLARGNDARNRRIRGHVATRRDPEGQRQGPLASGDSATYQRRPNDESRRQPEPESLVPSALAQTCQSIDWYAEGDSRVVEIGGIEVSVRFVGRKGRRARIAITAPAGTVFKPVDAAKTDRCGTYFN